MHAQGMLEPHEVEALCSQLHQLVPIDLSPQEMASVRRTENQKRRGISIGVAFLLALPHVPIKLQQPTTTQR